MDETAPPAPDSRPIGLRPIPSRAYSPGQVAGATFLGGPIAGSILLASNYVLSGQEAKRSAALYWGVALTAAVLVIAFFLPENTPNYLVPGIYTLAYQQFAKRTQGEFFESFCSSGGLKHSNWRVLGIGVACLTAVFGLLFAVLLLLPQGWLPE